MAELNEQTGNPDAPGNGARKKIPTGKVNYTTAPPVGTRAPGSTVPSIGPATPQNGVFETNSASAARTPGQNGATPRTPGQNGPVEPAGFGTMPWQQGDAPSPLGRVNVRPPSTAGAGTELPAGRGVIGTIRRTAAQYGVPAALALAVAKHESGFQQEAVSSAGAIGIMQLMPDTAAGLNVDPNNWKQNIQGGIRLLSELHHQYGGNWSKALQAYNGGPGSVGRADVKGYAQDVFNIARSISGGQLKPAGGSTGLVTISAPLQGDPHILSSFGPRGGSDFHNGVDIAAPYNSPVAAMVSGTVTDSSYSDGAGHTLVITDKSGRQWFYSHLAQRSPVKIGEKVPAGTQIGAVGGTGQTTGPHLHVATGMLSIAEKAPSGRAAFDFASRQLGQPYVWGGASRKQGGFDCSGLVQWAYQQIGINLPRVAADQYKVGKPVGLKNLRSGDLVFLEPGSSGPGHVVIYAGGGKVIAAPHTGTDVQMQNLKDVISSDGYVGSRRIVKGGKALTWMNPMAVVRRATRVGWGKTGTMGLSATDFLAPGAGGVNGAGGTASGNSSSFLPGVNGLDVQAPQSIEAAVTPGGQTGIPSNAAAWQRILNSGSSSPETQTLADKAGAMVTPTTDPLAAMYAVGG